MCDTQGSLVKAAVDGPGPRQGHHCESHLVCELPFPRLALFLAPFSAPWVRGHWGRSRLGWVDGAGPGRERRCRESGGRGVTILGNGGARAKMGSLGLGGTYSKQSRSILWERLSLRALASSSVFTLLDHRRFSGA